MNFKKPSKVQEKALPLLLSNPPRNMIAQSQSGTGKTAAFVIAVLSRVDYGKPHQPQALLLAPTRELARQIQNVVKTVGQFLPDLIVEAAVPGAVDRATGVRGSVVVGTPGTVMDTIRRRQFDPRELRIFVIDEADNMLDQQGMGEQCMKVKKYVPMGSYHSVTARNANMSPTACFPKTFRSCCSRRPFQTESFNMLSASHRTRTPCVSSSSNSLSRAYRKCTWTAHLRVTNTMSW